MSTEYAVTLSRYQFGDMLVEYMLTTESQTIELRLYPVSMIGEVATRREFLQTHEALLQPKSAPLLRAHQVESLVQCKLVSEPVRGYGQGIALRYSDTLLNLRCAGQEIQKSDGKTEGITWLHSSRGYACEHHLFYHQGDKALRFSVVFHNESQEPFSLELLASFSLGRLTPFAAGDTPNPLHLHRFRSFWSAEVRHMFQSVEELGLERSWATHGERDELFGEDGSMAVLGYFPLLVLCLQNLFRHSKDRIFW